MTTTELIDLLKKYEHGGASGRPREVMICVGDEIYDINITGISTGDGLFAELFLEIDAQPERKTGRWIPCSEQLPEECETVLGWIERDAWGDDDIPTKKQECAIGWQIEGRWHFDGYSSKGTRCLAWMPLPEPYREAEHE